MSQHDWSQLSDDVLPVSLAKGPAAAVLSACLAALLALPASPASAQQSDAPQDQPSAAKKPETEQEPAQDGPKSSQPNRQEMILKVRKLVRQLDADALADRDAAERALTKMGPRVLELLPPADRNMPGDVRQRLARIANSLETSAANLNGDPTRVSLSGQIRLDDALQELFEQTGNRCEVDSGEVVTASFKNQLYMKALDDLLDQANLNVNLYGGEPGVMALVERPAGESNRSDRATYAGAFRLEPLRVQAVRNLRNPDVQGCRVAMRIEWEPRLRPISISQPLDKLTVVDDLGNPLAVEGQGSRGSEVASGASGMELELPLSLPQRGAAQLASLKGELTVLIPGRIETFEFNRRLDESAGMELRKAGCTVVLDRVRKNGDLFQVMIRVRFDEARESLQSHRGWIFQNEAFMVDGKGRRIAHAGLETNRQAEDEIGVSYLFALEDGLEDCRFIYRSPAVILQLPVPYELKDIPLP